VNIGNRIREIRISKGVTQTYIDQKLGKFTGWLSSIEKGRRNISAVEAKQIADLLGVPLEEFFITNEFHNLRNTGTGN
jgi:transcriptional regulator with XRE-family HTH domain